MNFINPKTGRNVRWRDLTGLRVGAWTVLRPAPSRIVPSGQRVTMWTCRCDCGAVHKVRATHLVRGLSRRCPACRADVARYRYLLTIRGKTRPLSDWLKDSGVSLDAYDQRVCRGWNKAAAATTPPRRGKKAA
jgi:hypothetical protein